MIKPVTLGFSGDEVRRWQRVLRRSGSPLRVTGRFDEQTLAETIAWQAARGMPTDGVVWPSVLRQAEGRAAPGAPMSLPDMLRLTLAYQRRPGDPFTPALLLAIFWEESLFKNIRQQGGGTAIGFGQIEPAELPKITTERAAELGYYVEGVSAATRELPDELSVTVPSCYLLHLYHASKSDDPTERARFALRGYAGVYYEGPSPLTKEERLAIVAGWRACESALLELPLSLDALASEGARDRRGIEDAFMAALRLSRPFQAEAQRARLFPEGWERALSEDEGAGAGEMARAAAPLLLALGVGLGAAAAAEIVRPGALAVAWRAVRVAAGRTGRLARKVIR